MEMFCLTRSIMNYVPCQIGLNLINYPSVSRRQISCFFKKQKRCKNELLAGDLHIDGKSLTRVSANKFLGIHIDEDLSWKPQLLYLASTVARNIGVGFKVINTAPQRSI